MTGARRAPALAFVTLGCPKNTVDSEAMLGLLAGDGFRTVGDPAAADLAVINTCAFLGSAVRESRDAIGRLAELRRHGRLRGLIVAGCLAQRAGGALLDEFPEVDAVLGTGRWADVAGVARRLLAGDGEREARTGAPGGALDPDTPRALSTPRHLAYLKISEGCDHRCTFCLIPRLRGAQRSRPVADLVAEAGRLAAAGVRELSLVGQDTTAYGSDLPGRPSLANLLAALDRVDGLHWIRVHYTYPRGWDDRLIEVWAGARRVLPYVDLPLQHVADGPLRRMGRGMTGAQTRALVRRIRADLPGAVLRTTFIAGFPGETEADFAELCDYVAGEGFDHAVVFAYEREGGTPAARLTPPVPAAERRRRRARLLEIQQRVSRARLARRVGEHAEVMIDGPAGRGRHAARLPGMAYEVDGGVVVDGGGFTAGEIATVRITGATDYDLFAQAGAAGLPRPRVKGRW